MVGKSKKGEMSNTERWRLLMANGSARFYLPLHGYRRKAKNSRSEEVIVPLNWYRCIRCCHVNIKVTLHFSLYAPVDRYTCRCIYTETWGQQRAKEELQVEILFQHPHTSQSTGVNGRVKMLRFPCTIQDFVTTRHFIFFLSAAAALVYHIISNSYFILISWRRSSSVITWRLFWEVVGNAVGCNGIVIQFYGHSFVFFVTFFPSLMGNKGYMYTCWLDWLIYIDWIYA